MIQIQVHQPYLHVYVCIYIYIWYLPQRSTIFDLPFWNLVVWDDNRAINWKGGPYIYIIIYRYIFKIYLNKHVYIYTGICTSHKNANFANFPGFKIQDSGENFLNPGLVMDSRSKKFFPQSWILNPKKVANFANFPGFKIQDSGGNFLNPGLALDSWPWIQEVFPRILNPQTKANFANFPGFKIQDSGGNFLNPALALDSISFSQNLESWILSSKQMQTLQTFLDP